MHTTAAAPFSALPAMTEANETAHVVATPAPPAGSTVPASRAPPAAQRPGRDDGNAFFSQMDVAMARMPPATRPKRSTNSRRPPPTPLHSEAAVAAAARARKRVGDRRRLAAGRQDADMVGPPTEQQAAAAALVGTPATTPASSIALATASTAVAAAIAATTAASPAHSTSPSEGTSAAAVLSLLRPVLMEVGTVLKGLLAAHVEERKASAADMMAVRRALVVILANSAENKDVTAAIRALTDSMALSVEKLATTSATVAYNNAHAAGGQGIEQQRQGNHQEQLQDERRDLHQVQARAPGVANTPVLPPSAKAPWAIPKQVCAASEIFCRSLFVSPHMSTLFWSRY